MRAGPGTDRNWTGWGSGIETGAGRRWGRVSGDGLRVEASWRKLEAVVGGWVGG